MKKVGLSILTIFLFLILMVLGIVIYSFLITLILNIPIIKGLLNIILGGLLEHAIEIGGVISLFFIILQIIETIIDKIDSEYTETCMFVLGIISTVIYSFAFIFNIISIFTGGFDWRMLIVSFAILFISIKVINDKSIA